MTVTARPRPPAATPPRKPATSQARFAKRARAVRRRPWLVALLGLLVVTLAGVAVWLFWFSSVLSARTVVVRSASGELGQALKAEIVSLADVPLGSPLARVDTQAIAEQVVAQPLVAEATVSRSYPETVVVQVTMRQPVLAVRNPAGEVELVDRLGFVYDRVAKAPADLPQVTAATPPAGIEGTESETGADAPTAASPGAARPLSAEAMRSAIAVVQALPAALRAEVAKVTVAGANLVTLDVAVGKKTVRVVWGGPSDADLKADVVAILLQQKGVRTIDVSAPRNPVTT